MVVKKFDGNKVGDCNDAANIFRAVLEAADKLDQEKEHFWVIGMNQSHQIKYVDCVSIGSLTQSLVHPREVFRMAVLRGVAAVLFGHNHPGGSTTPSPEDTGITNRLREVGDLLGIGVVDHIIIGNTAKGNPWFYSYAAGDWTGKPTYPALEGLSSTKATKPCRKAKRKSKKTTKSKKQPKKAGAKPRANRTSRKKG